MTLTTAGQILVTGALTWLTTGHIFHPESSFVAASTKHKRVVVSVKESSQSTSIDDTNASNARKRPIAYTRAPSSKTSKSKICFKPKTLTQRPKGFSSEKRLEVRRCVACFQEKMGCGLHGFNECDQQGLNYSSCPFPPASAFPGCGHLFTVCSTTFGKTLERRWRLSAQEVCVARSVLIFCCINRFGVWHLKKCSRSMR